MTSLARNGEVATRAFCGAPVGMPILAVNELAKEGELGSEFCFRARDGVIFDALTGNNCDFVKTNGVYFMRLYFPKKNPDSSFNTRPDASVFVRPEL